MSKLEELSGGRRPSNVSEEVLCQTLSHLESSQHGSDHFGSAVSVPSVALPRGAATLLDSHPSTTALVGSAHLSGPCVLPAGLTPPCRAHPPGCTMSDRSVRSR